MKTLCIRDFCIFPLILTRFLYHFLGCFLKKWWWCWCLEKKNNLINVSALSPTDTTAVLVLWTLLFSNQKKSSSWTLNQIEYQSTHRYGGLSIVEYLTGPINLLFNLYSDAEKREREREREREALAWYLYIIRPQVYLSKLKFFLILLSFLFQLVVWTKWQIFCKSVP